jgi:hypothetical protein
MAATSAETVPATAAVIVEESAALSEAELRGFALPSADHAVAAAQKDQNATAREDLQLQTSRPMLASTPAPRDVAPALLPRTFLGKCRGSKSWLVRNSSPSRTRPDH